MKAGRRRGEGGSLREAGRTPPLRLSCALFAAGLLLFVGTLPAVHSHGPGEDAATFPVCRMIIQGGTPERPPPPPVPLTLSLSAAAPLRRG